MEAAVTTLAEHWRCTAECPIMTERGMAGLLTDLTVLSYRLEHTELYEKAVYQSSYCTAVAIRGRLGQPGICDMKKVA